MTSDYNPTRREVLEEMARGVFNRDNLKDIGVKLKQTGEGFISMNVFLNICPYILPTTIQGVREVSQTENKNSRAENVGLSIGLVTGLALDAAQVIGYKYAIQHDHSEALLIPVITNVASGVYEVGRKMYTKAKQRLLDRNNL